MPEVDFSELSAVFLNCSLERDAAESHTMRLVRRAAGIMTDEGVAVDVVHVRDHRIPFGMATDMSDHGEPVDDWPDLQRRLDGADIVVLGSPIWLGTKSSVATLVIERMYAGSAETNDRGQYRAYGKVAGCVVTGNEDGVKAVSRDVLYALQHIGYMVPPAADCGWIGSIGPGPSYGDEVEEHDAPTGYDSEFTNRTCTTMAWNLMHTARLLRANGGFPTPGNAVGEWRHVTNAEDQNPARAS